MLESIAYHGAGLTGLLLVAGIAAWLVWNGLAAMWSLFVDAGRWIYSQPFWVTAIYAFVMLPVTVAVFYFDVASWGSTIKERSGTLMGFLVLPFLAVGGVIAWVERQWRKRKARAADPANET